jgi:hypothetical protein
MSSNGSLPGDRLTDLLLHQEVVSILRRAEPVPARVSAAAREAFGWRSLAVAIAGLEFDSAVDDDDLARVRDAGSERHLRFRDPDRVAEVSVIDGGRRLVGRLDPPMSGSVVMRHPGSPDVSTEVDPLGRFMFDRLPRGAVSLRSVPSEPGVRSFQTEWVTI